MVIIQRESTKRDLAEFQALLRSEEARLWTLAGRVRAARRDRIDRQIAEVRNMHERVAEQLRALRQGMTQGCAA